MPEGSDIDLVVLVNKETLEVLEDMADNDTGSGEKTSMSLNFGRLNLICETDERAFQSWRQGTKLLRQLVDLRGGKPVSREEAVKVLKNINEIEFLLGYSNSMKYIKDVAKAKMEIRKKAKEVCDAVRKPPVRSCS